LACDIFTIAPEAIEKAKVDLTIFGGKVIYRR
jgi:predicted amidohydrolase YtcJ